MATHAKQRKTMENNKSDDDFQLISEEYLKVYIQYAKEIEMYKDRFEDMNPDPKSFEDITDDRLKVLPVKISSEKYDGIKIVLPGEITSYRSEYDRAQAESEYALKILDLVNALKMGEKIENDKIIHDLTVTEDNLSEQLNLNFLKFKKEKQDWLKTEQDLSHALDVIKTSLKIDKSDSRLALQTLNNIFNMNIDAFMLKKNPEFYKCVRSLTMYLGNIHIWDWSRLESDRHIANSREIRQSSNKLLKKFGNLFEYASDVRNFSDEFEKDCKEFLSSVQELSSDEISALHVEPYTRIYFLDQIINNI